ncbi:MAG: hypothetical protein NUV56_00575 [Candidatus Uhrbacteria bacterium]|nr:hypothetical protein [Candidatus Uhrbacteria bacterium]
MIRLSFKVDGERQVSVALGVIGDRAGDMRKLFKAIGHDFFENYQRKTFKSEGASSGDQWNTKYSKRYERYKLGKLGSLRPALFLTGTLEHAATTPGASGNIFSTGPQSFEFGLSGSEFPGALVHQRGRFEGKMSRAKIQKRKIINVNQALETRWAKAVHRWIVEGTVNV